MTAPTTANAGRLMDDAARLTPPGWDFSIQWSGADLIAGRGAWMSGWYPTHRSGLTGDAALDATVIGRGPTAADALDRLLAQSGRLPRWSHDYDRSIDEAPQAKEPA
jgi:hypothetical protein